MKPPQFWIIPILSHMIAPILFGQDTIPYPSMKEVEPIVSVSLQQNGNDYKYDYTVFNGSGASQDIWEFMIEVLSAGVDGSGPSDWDVSRATRTDLEAITWASVDSTKDISAGLSKLGFQIISSGLPSIVHFFAVGYLEIPYGEFIPQEGTDDIFINSAQGRTLGPKDPPTPFVALDFLDTLISMAEEALSLGWIEETYGEKIMNDLNDAREKIEESPEDAKEILEALIPYIIDDGCDWAPPDPSQYHLTSEGCALLRYNVEYLIEQIE